MPKKETPPEFNPFNREENPYDALGIEGYKVSPKGFYASMDGGIWKKAVSAYGEDVLLSHNRIVVAKRYVDLDDGKEAWELRWFNDGQWQSGVFDTDDLMLTREMTKTLTSRGISVQSAVLSKYLDDLRFLNEACIPIQAKTRHLGWQNGMKDFLYAKREDLLFHPKGQKLVDHLAHYGKAGSLAQWQAAVAELEQYPTAALFVVGALAAPLLRVFGQRSFALDLAGGTTSGKTTAMEIGNSVWGHPEHLWITWNNTQVFLEQMLSIHNGLPLALDETQTVKDPKVVADVLYMLHEETGRGRGAKAGGIDDLFSWSTIAFSTGEQSLPTFTQDGGTRGRIVTTCERPFPPNEAELVNRLRVEFLANYGHAGPAFVDKLMSVRRAWPGLRRRRDEIQGHLLACATDDLSGRRAAYVATLCAAAELAVKWGIVSWQAPMEFWEGLLVPAAGAEDDDRPLAALTAAHTWYVRNPERFITREVPGQMPLGGWAGIADDKHLAFFRDQLEDLLFKQGYRLEAVIGLWKERKYLDIDPGRNTKRKRMPVGTKGVEANLAHMIAIKKAALVKLQLAENAEVIDMDSRRGG